KHGSGLRIYCEVPVLVTCNYTKHTSLSDQFLTIRRRHGLALFWGHIRDLWLIRTTGTQCAAYMWYAPYALLICDENKPIPVDEAIRGFEIVSIAFDVVCLAITVLISQQRQMPGLRFRNNDIIIGEDEQSARMLQARDKQRGGESLHHPWRLSCIWYEQRSALRGWIGFRRGEIFRLNEKASAPTLDRDCWRDPELWLAEWSRPAGPWPWNQSAKKPV